LVNIITMIMKVRIRWAGHAAQMGVQCAYRLLVEKPEGRRPLGRPRRRWVDNVMIGLIEIESGGVDWICRARDRDKWRALVNAVMNFRVPYSARKPSNGYTTCAPPQILLCSIQLLNSIVLSQQANCTD
jgi:hypothetical protein